MVAVKANIDPTRRAGELTEDEIKKIIDIISKPLEYDLPKWVVNRKKDLSLELFINISSIFLPVLANVSKNNIPFFCAYIDPSS